LKKYEIVKKNSDFNDIINKGAYLKNKYYSIYYKNSSLTYPRFGLAVSKKCGNAVVRNKIKRQLRMIVDNHKELFNNNMEYIILVRKGIVDISFKQMEDSLVELITRKESLNEKN